MSWATSHIEKLAKGETATFRPRGHSMSPRIQSGDLCTVVPVDLQRIAAGDVVLCTVNGRHFLHIVKAVKMSKGEVRFQIGNMKGHVNGWIGRNRVHGILTGVEP